MATIEGRNPVIEAIKNDREIDKIMIANIISFLNERTCYYFSHFVRFVFIFCYLEQINTNQQ